MKREVTIANDFGSAITAKFLENTDGILLEKDTYNYYDNPHDFMKLATDSYDWLVRGVLP